MLIAGAVSAVAGLSILFGVVAYWSSSRFSTIGNVLPAVAGTSLIVLGLQNAMGGFLLSILNGNQAEFLRRTDVKTSSDEAVADKSEPRKAA